MLHETVKIDEIDSGSQIKRHRNSKKSQNISSSSEKYHSNY